MTSKALYCESEYSAQAVNVIEEDDQCQHVSRFLLPQISDNELECTIYQQVSVTYSTYYLL